MKSLISAARVRYARAALRVECALRVRIKLDVWHIEYRHRLRTALLFINLLYNIAG